MLRVANRDLGPVRNTMNTIEKYEKEFFLDFYQ